MDRTQALHYVLQITIAHCELEKTTEQMAATHSLCYSSGTDRARQPWKKIGRCSQEPAHKQQMQKGIGFETGKTMSQPMDPSI